MVSDVRVLRELFQGTDAFPARPPNMQWINQYFRFGNGRDSRGLLFSEGAEWAEQRKFTLRGDIQAPSHSNKFNLSKFFPYHISRGANINLNKN